MITFYRKTLHSFFSFADTLSPKPSPYSKSHHHGFGLGLISDDNLIPINSPNILQSSSLLRPRPRKDFIDDLGGGVDGLMSCTETLGFESSDERFVDDETMAVDDDDGVFRVRVRRRTVVERKFPPPLSSLNQHGQPNFYLRPVRRDGRLELTEIRIERTEILQACREDGRLRLHLIKDDEKRENDDDEDDDERIEEEGEEKGEEVEGFVREGKVEFRRCVEVVNHRRRREHHHQYLDVWRQHCVTTS